MNYRYRLSSSVTYIDVSSRPSQLFAKEWFSAHAFERPIGNFCFESIMKTILSHLQSISRYLQISYTPSKRSTKVNWGQLGSNWVNQSFLLPTVYFFKFNFYFSYLFICLFVRMSGIVRFWLHNRKQIIAASCIAWMSDATCQYFGPDEYNVARNARFASVYLTVAAPMNLKWIQILNR